MATSPANLSCALDRIASHTAGTSTRATKTLPERRCAHPLTAMTGAGHGSTTLGGRSAADLLQVQQRTIPDTISDCGRYSTQTAVLPPNLLLLSGAAGLS